MIFWVLSVMTWLVVAAGLFGVTVAGWYVWGKDFNMDDVSFDELDV